ncbi:hypothetical protein M9979_13355 [Sphingomonas sp. RP10(2022)]|uniref:Uncharacterized protein n=1 Tax=Sphingomonas liriopis TaxID=2949094 RepID=A0A9X2HZR8_9SPHN|nr:hypothetical protein [Sphingomonas liriopis]MCP3735860.1 hypothetical protein [Sphingomonas liriopis]
MYLQPDDRSQRSPDRSPIAIATDVTLLLALVVVLVIAPFLILAIVKFADLTLLPLVGDGFNHIHQFRSGN